MKKSLVALAALAAVGTASAQSTVSIDGILDAGYQSIDYKGKKVNGIANNGASTSQINFRGTEDLGNGLKATFRVETDWNTVSTRGNTGAGTTSQTDNTVAAASSFANGEVRVGVNGGFGAVDLGVVNYNTLTSFTTGQPFGTAIGSAFRALAINDVQGTSAVRSDNSIKYVSPDLMGFKVSLYKANKQTKAGTGVAGDTSFSTTFGAYDMQGTTEVGVNYASGPIAASFSQLKQDYKNVGTGNTDSTVNTFGANYTIAAAKLFLLYQTNQNNNKSTDNKYYALSATYSLGAPTLMASIGKLENAAGLKSDLVAIGGDYALSKRTSAYLRYESINDKAGVVANPSSLAAVPGDNTRVRTAIGVRHNF